MVTVIKPKQRDNHCESKNSKHKIVSTMIQIMTTTTEAVTTACVLSAAKQGNTITIAQV